MTKEKTLFEKCAFPAPLAWIKIALLALICAGIVIGCAQVRKTSYPSDFVYLEKREIKSEMALLAQYLGQLDEILLDSSSVSSLQQEQVVKLLVRIDESADKLGTGGVRTHHLVIDDHIDQFKKNVTIALRDASADPPNYFALGRLSGSCAACHQYR